MAQITFGKWQGWDTKDLAKFTDGRSYLSWGAEKLQSPKWQKEFAQALKDTPVTEIDLDLEARMIMKSDAQIDPEDAYILARDTRAELIQDEQREKAMDEAKDRLFLALRQAGVSERGINAIFNLIKYGDIDELTEAEKTGLVKFTDAAKRTAVWNAVIGYDGDMDNIF